MEARRLPHEVNSLPVLARRLREAIGDLPDEVMDACTALNRLYIPTRYPDAHQEGAPVNLYRERDARNAIADLQIVADFLVPLARPSPS